MIGNPYETNSGMTSNGDTGTKNNNTGGVIGMEGVAAGLGGAVGAVLGSWFNPVNNGWWGNRGWGGGYGAGVGVDTVIDANTAGRITGLEAGVANIQNQISQNSIMGELEDIEGMVNTNFIAIMGGIKDNVNTYLTTSADIKTGIANANFTTLQSLNGLGASFSNQFNAQNLANLNSFNVLTTSMLQGFNEIGKDLAVSTNQLIAGQKDLGYAMKDCCCDIRSAVAAEGSATRALITDIEIQDKNTQIADLKAQVSNGEQTNALIAAMMNQTNVILQHLAPFASTTVR